MNLEGLDHWWELQCVPHQVGGLCHEIDSPFGWRCGSSHGIVLFELLNSHITQKFVDVSRKVDGPRRPSGVGSPRRRGIDRFPRGKGGDSRRPIVVGSMNLVEFLCSHHMWCLRKSNRSDGGIHYGQEAGHVGRQL